VKYHLLWCQAKITWTSLSKMLLGLTSPRLIMWTVGPLPECRGMILLSWLLGKLLEMSPDISSKGFEFILANFLPNDLFKSNFFKIRWNVVKSEKAKFYPKYPFLIPKPYSSVKYDHPEIETYFAKSNYPNFKVNCQVRSNLFYLCFNDFL